MITRSRFPPRSLRSLRSSRSLRSLRPRSLVRGSVAAVSAAGAASAVGASSNDNVPSPAFFFGRPRRGRSEGDESPDWTKSEAEPGSLAAAGLFDDLGAGAVPIPADVRMASMILSLPRRGATLMPMAPAITASSPRSLDSRTDRSMVCAICVPSAGAFPLALSTDSLTNYFARGFPQIIGARTGLSFVRRSAEAELHSKEVTGRSIHGEACSPSKEPQFST